MKSGLQALSLHKFKEDVKDIYIPKFTPSKAGNEKYMFGGKIKKGRKDKRRRRAKREEKLRGPLIAFFVARRGNYYDYFPENILN